MSNTQILDAIKRARLQDNEIVPIMKTLLHFLQRDIKNPSKYAIQTKLNEVRAESYTTPEEQAAIEKDMTGL
ncbi:hypothetical protein [Acidipila sp. EB88]|uniref:hypothetical protein n=1 Tax=Acidipila sp. EB88 TaxID=2305226 RepID=UPI000F5F6E49|nr:hypothetical protein [Acidipila sp. EB88]RRA48993.1 hypothetical protein D1Y84_12625 [Acidipila sp. EB88]